MSKRVYELAKDLNLSSREVLAALSGLGVIAKSHSSTVENDVAAKLKVAAESGTLKQLTAPPARPKAERPARPAAQRPSAERAPAERPPAERPRAEKPAAPAPAPVVEAPPAPEPEPQVVAAAPADG